MVVFGQTDYRRVFSALFSREKKLKGTRWSLAKVASETGIQASYLSNTAQKRAHFSSDQIYAVGEVLGLTDDETAYLDLLMRHERATHAGLRRQLKARLEEMRGEHLRAESVIDTSESPLRDEDRARYYLDPHIELLHMYLSLEGAPIELARIATAWQLPERKVGEVISFLQQVGLVSLRGKRWQVESLHQHLSRDSYLATPNQMLKRMKALEAFQRLPAQKAYSYIGTMTASEEAREEIQKLFLRFLQECEPIVRASRAQQIYHLQFDLFPWVSDSP